MKEEKRKGIIEMLQKAYSMEMETVTNYMAASINLDGFRAKHVRDTLEEEIQEELGHARRIGERIKVLEGTVPGSFSVETSQKGMQPGDPLDVRAIVEGVISAEEDAIAHYQKIIEVTEGDDPVTQDLCIELKGDEEGHRRLFRGFLAEFERTVVSAS